MAGQLSTVHQAGLSVFMILQGLYYQVPSGIGKSTCQYIGYEMGNANVSKAQAYVKYFLVITLAFNILMFIIFMLKSDFIFFMDKKTVEALDMFTMVSFAVLTFNHWQTVLYGIVRALNLNMEAVFTYFVARIFLTVPFAYILTFQLNMVGTDSKDDKFVPDGL